MWRKENEQEISILHYRQLLQQNIDIDRFWHGLCFIPAQHSSG